MSSIQTIIPSSAGGFSGASVAIPAGSAAARIQPTLADADWSAGQRLTCSVNVLSAGVQELSLDNWQLQTGALQSDPTRPVPCYCQVNAPVNLDGTRTAWPYDTALITLTCVDGSVAVGAVVSFADDPANLPAPVLPPGFVAGTKI